MKKIRKNVVDELYTYMIMTNMRLSTKEEC